MAYQPPEMQSPNTILVVITEVSSNHISDIIGEGNTEWECLCNSSSIFFLLWGQPPSLCKWIKVVDSERFAKGMFFPMALYTFFSFLSFQSLKHGGWRMSITLWVESLSPRTLSPTLYSKLFSEQEDTSCDSCLADQCHDPCLPHFSFYGGEIWVIGRLTNLYPFTSEYSPMVLSLPGACSKDPNSKEGSGTPRDSKSLISSINFTSVFHHEFYLEWHLFYSDTIWTDWQGTNNF